jgi:hypothetical protein
MQALPSFWPCAEDQAVMAAWFAEYHDLAYGMCYLFGWERQRGKTTDEAARHVRFIVESQKDTCVCGYTYGSTPYDASAPCDHTAFQLPKEDRP